MTNGQDSNKISELHQMQMGQQDSKQMGDIGDTNEDYKEETKKPRPRPINEFLDSLRPDVDKLLEE